MTDPDRILAYDSDVLEPDETATATFALGCFWGPDAAFGAMEGVIRTRVGYAGGTSPDPTYDAIGDHSEAVQVDYDPDRVSFATLVDEALGCHDPRTQPRKRQYQHVLFYGSDDERRTIEERLAALDGIPRGAVETRLEPLGAFHVAETYHQKFNLRSQRAVQSAFEDAGYSDSDVRESPAAAKLNGATAGYDAPGTREL